MRKYIILLVSLALAVGALAETKKPTVLVCNFETAGGAKAYLSESTAEMLMAALTYVGDYKVIAEDKKAKVMESIGKDAGDNITKSEAIGAAEKAGAKYAVTGKITKDGDYYTVTVNIIETATGDVKETKSSKHKYQRNISKSIDDIVGLTE
jgi:TolB-like protein